MDSNAVHKNIASEISAIAAKATPLDADYLLIEDSAAANVKKSIIIQNLPVIHKSVSGEINALTSKSSPVAGDVVIIEDSESGYAKKKATLSSLASATKPYFYGTYNPVTNPTTTSATYTATGASWSFTLENGIYLVIQQMCMAGDAKNRTIQERFLISGISGSTWTRSGTTVTVTATGHGLDVGDRIDISVSSDTGAIPLGVYVVQTVATNTYTIVGVNTGATSGTLTYQMICAESMDRTATGAIFKIHSGNYVMTAVAGSRTFSFEWLISAGTATGRNFRIELIKLA